MLCLLVYLYFRFDCIFKFLVLGDKPMSLSLQSLNFLTEELDPMIFRLFFHLVSLIDLNEFLLQFINPLCNNILLSVAFIPVPCAINFFEPLLQLQYLSPELLFGLPPKPNFLPQTLQLHLAIDPIFRHWFLDSNPTKIFFEFPLHGACQCAIWSAIVVHLFQDYTLPVS